jgi:2-keto-3-deoxy-L-rhamnonate aldolase RhmA
MNNLEKLKKKIANNELAVGASVVLTDSSVSEQLGEIGFDFVWIDSEHTVLDKKDIQLHIIAARGTGAATFVRVVDNDPAIVKPILEMGPSGVIFPFIKTAEEARKAVEACLYPPHGNRGYGPIRALRYGVTSKLQYVQEASSQLWKILMIEHIDAVKNLDEILAVEGVDALIVGPNDLSGSIGLLGQVDHPEVKKLYDIIAEKANKAGVPFGVSNGYDEVLFKEWVKRGVSFISLGSDYSFITKAAHNDQMLTRNLKK